jgi:hypothetical protein
VQASSLRSILLAATIVLFAAGLVARAAPLGDVDGRLLKQWPTEDGYLMLTIARNMALGLGMSTAEGSLPTNGTQPLATGVWALAFLAVDGAKKAGVGIVLVLELLFSCLSALLLYRVAAKLYRPLEAGRAWAGFAAALWFSSSLVVPHSMNALESGLYALLVLLTADRYLEAGRPNRSGVIQFDWRAIFVLAALLALCFWARNDAVFLIAAFCLSCLVAFGSRPGVALDNLPKVLAAGTLTVVFALPWLANNLAKFGHLMPISGVAQSAAATVGNNSYLVPLVWFEYLTVVLPVPHSLEGKTLVTAVLSLVVLGVAVAGALQARRLPLEVRHFAAFVGLYAVFLTGYYGVVHGAPWFMARYLFPLSPFIAIAAVAAAARAVAWQPLRGRGVAIAAAAAVGAVAVNAALNLRLYRAGSTHMHEQVVHWVQDNVPESAWIGAVQTGTLGFFHDRTVNLDGKVNPEALEAVLADRVPQYVAEKQLVVLADWYGIDAWTELDGMKGHYRVLVADGERNLSVVARNDWHPVPQHAERIEF